ncbi:hypothetical protein FNV43_RR00502 [Rhamnella rubrinervis]|uniref:Uncharacterized protein n=1 Tax=Rhamnella rubrinervis TaxID=2594499 RepID=A0A8K0HNS9_9ROSA|nr:hypothetical protein FNV43_RR00502 [Rhamnella rubrinervis]
MAKKHVVNLYFRLRYIFKWLSSTRKCETKIKKTKGNSLRFQGVDLIFLRLTQTVEELNDVVFGGLLLAMGDDKSSSIVMAARDRERDRELLIPVADSVNDDASSKPSSSTSSSHNTGREGNYCLFSLMLVYNSVSKPLRQSYMEASLVLIE